MSADRQERQDWHLAYGTYEQALQMIGFVTERSWAEVSVEWSMIKYFAASIEDGNPSYWDDRFAVETWGGVVAPPGMLMTWYFPIPWRPDGRPEFPGVAPKVPLPGTRLLNQTTTSEFFTPIRVGERLSFFDEVVDVSPEKHATVGYGHFVTTTMTFQNSNDEVVATNTFTVFRYSPHEEPSS